MFVRRWRARPPKSAPSWFWRRRSLRGDLLLRAMILAFGLGLLGTHRVFPMRFRRSLGSRGSRRWEPLRRIRRQARQEPAIAGNVAIVLCKRSGKKVAALRVGHKIDVIRLRGIKRRAQRGFARVPDGTGW